LKEDVKNNYDIADPRYMSWLKDRHPHRFQELSSLEELSLAAAFSESDSYGLGLINSLTLTHSNTIHLGISC